MCNAKLRKLKEIWLYSIWGANIQDTVTVVVAKCFTMLMLSIMLEIDIVIYHIFPYKCAWGHFILQKVCVFPCMDSIYCFNSQLTILFIALRVVTKRQYYLVLWMLCNCITDYNITHNETFHFEVLFMLDCFQLQLAPFI